MTTSQYAHPEALVSTEWVAEHLKDPKVRIIESNEDVLLYDTGHIPGAVHVDWRRDLNDQIIRDYLDPKGFAELAGRIGITPETTVVFYGDKSNWWACYALWVFSLFGHKDLRIVNGGRDKWISEKRELTRDVPKYASTDYPVPPKRLDDQIRAFYDETLAQSKSRGPLIDVRSPGEYKGEITVRDLVKNALRMRPDRIILGEVRGAEAFDMLQAMNTGHEGSLTTVHANSPRDALARIENMVSMANLNIPERAVRHQIAAALHAVVQIARLSDGTRKVITVSEILGMDGDSVAMRDIFEFERSGIDEGGKVRGAFRATGIRPQFAERLAVAGARLRPALFESKAEV